MIDFQGVTFRYPRQTTPALQAIDLSVTSGRLFGLLGPNGSGKTTLISILAGLLPVTDGTVRVDGLDVTTRRREIQRFCALVPQENAFYPSLTVTENLNFFVNVQSVDPALRRARIDEVVAITGLESALSHRTATLSGGLKRRVSIALGLLSSPRLLLLDEPTVGVDPLSRQFLLDAIRRINAGGTTVVYSSHYMEEIEYLCDDVAILDAGRVLAQGSLGALLAAARGQRLRIDTVATVTAQQQAAIANIAQASVRGTRIDMEACPETTLAPLLAVLQAEGVSIAAVRYGITELQEVFLALTRANSRSS